MYNSTNTIFPEQMPTDVTSEVTSLGRLVDFMVGERFYADGTLYNPSTPFYDVHDGQRKRLIMLRHESLYSETDSEVVICDFGSKQIVDEAPVFKNSQDPYYLGKFRDANDEFWQVVGMVRIEVDQSDTVTGWQDVLYKYKDSVMELGRGENVVEPWLAGIEKWKDLRFQKFGGEILVTPRPQGGEFGGLGRVGKFMTKNLDTLPHDLDKFARDQDPDSIVKGLFADGHWGAVNQLLGRYRRSDFVRVVGHDACVGTDNLRQYSSTYFWLNVMNSEVVGLKTIATADDYPSLDPKPGHGLGKIVFTSGIVEVARRTELMTGVGDRTIGVLPVDIRKLDRQIALSRR